MAKPDTKRSRHVKSTNIANLPFLFLKLPLEIRNIIYRMLLATSYTYTETLRGKRMASGTQQTLARTTELVSTGRFNLSPAILQVNKQISEEANKILYGANEFIIVNIGPTIPLESADTSEIYNRRSQTNGLGCFHDVAAFRRLPQAKIRNPVLNVTLATVLGKQQYMESWVTLIVTPEAIPRLFDSLWHYNLHFGDYKHCFLALNFCNGNLSRHSLLHENILKVWDQMYGFREIRLTGNIDEVVSNHLKQPMDQCPFEDIMVHSIDMFHSKAESSYRSNDFANAYFYWYHLQRYWAYHERLERITKKASNNSPFTQLPESRIKKALNATLYKVGVSAFGILKILLCLRNYPFALDIAKYPDDWLKKHDISMAIFRTRTCIAPILKAKIAFCCALTLLAQGQSQEVDYYIRYGIACLRRYSDLYRQRTIEDLFNDLRKSINNELIERGSRWRYGRKDKVGLKSKGGDDWRLHTGCLPFWDWLEIPDEDPGPESWKEDAGLLGFGW
jgi:hypothetical protein